MPRIMDEEYKDEYTRRALYSSAKHRAAASINTALNDVSTLARKHARLLCHPDTFEDGLEIDECINELELLIKKAQYIMVVELRDDM